MGKTRLEVLLCLIYYSFLTNNKMNRGEKKIKKIYSNKLGPTINQKKNSY